MDRCSSDDEYFLTQTTQRPISMSENNFYYTSDTVDIVVDYFDNNDNKTPQDRKRN